MKRNTPATNKRRQPQAKQRQHHLLNADIQAAPLRRGCGQGARDADGGIRAIRKSHDHAYGDQR